MAEKIIQVQNPINPSLVTTVHAPANAPAPAPKPAPVKLKK
jgi:hypothetical protein